MPNSTKPQAVDLFCSLCGVLQAAVVVLLQVPLLQGGHAGDAGKVQVIAVDEAAGHARMSY